jgi:DNA-binding MarR family transcriptional regulator
MAGRRHVVRRLALEVRALTAAADMFNRDMARRTGVNTTDMRALELLGRRQGMTAGELAIELHLTTGAVTGVIDRLERAGYARRLPDPNDRRRLLVETTDATAARDAEVFGPLLGTTQEALDALSDQELAVIGRFLDQIRTVTATHADALAASLEEHERAGHDAS